MWHKSDEECIPLTDPRTDDHSNIAHSNSARNDQCGLSEEDFPFLLIIAVLFGIGFVASCVYACYVRRAKGNEKEKYECVNCV